MSTLSLSAIWGARSRFSRCRLHLSRHNCTLGMRRRIAQHSISISSALSQQLPQSPQSPLSLTNFRSTAPTPLRVRVCVGVCVLGVRMWHSTRCRRCHHLGETTLTPTVTATATGSPWHALAACIKIIASEMTTAAKSGCGCAPMWQPLMLQHVLTLYARLRVPTL